MGMTKKESIDLFGGKVKDLADALGVTVQAVYQWPDVLTVRQADRVLGAYTRLLSSNVKRGPDEVAA